MNANSMDIIEHGSSLNKLSAVLEKQNIEFSLEPSFSIISNHSDTSHYSARIAPGVILIVTYEQNSKKIVGLLLKFFKEPRESKANDIHVEIKSFYFKNNKFYFTSYLNVNF